MEIAANQYETVMTIIRREHYNPANRTIFLEADDAGQQKFSTSGSFPGRLNGQEVQVLSVPSMRYQEAVKTLYRVFQDNHIPWQTILWAI